jgi:hypothetical protein
MFHLLMYGLILICIISFSNIFTAIHSRSFEILASSVVKLSSSQFGKNSSGAWKYHTGISLHGIMLSNSDTILKEMIQTKCNAKLHVSGIRLSVNMHLHL